MKSELGRMFKKKKKICLESMINTCLTVGTNKKKNKKNRIHDDLW